MNQFHINQVHINQFLMRKKCITRNFSNKFYNYSQRYNATTQVCCLGKINKKSYGSNTYCCKKNSYNHATDMCCNYMVKRKRPGDNSCCGNFPYNADRYLCCSGKLRVKRSRYHLCCFGQTYDNRYYMCQARRDGVIGGYVLRRGGGSAAWRPDQCKDLTLYSDWGY